MARSVNLTAALEPRDSDVSLPDFLFSRIPPFSDLKSTGKLANFPGAVILRRFRKGEVICQQGDPGWTAFYIPTAAELAVIRDAPRVQSTAAIADLVKADAKVADLEKQGAEESQDAKKAASLKAKIDEAKEQILELKGRISLLLSSIEPLEDAIAGHGPAEDERATVVARGEQAMARLRSSMTMLEAGDDADALAHLRGMIAAGVAEKRTHAKEVEGYDPALAVALRDLALAEEARKVASVHLTIQLPRRGAPKGLLAKIGGILSGKREKPTGRRPASIPIDGPRDLDYETREGVLNEGELFGEMSCLHRTPRSATVTASRDCYMLEMLRNVLESMNRDAGFKSKLDLVYRERVLRLQLRNLPILLELEERHVERLCQGAELVEIPSGGLLYDENEPSDAMHLIRAGIIKVMLNVSYLIGESDVTDWSSLRTELLESSDPASGPKHRLWDRLPEPARIALVTGPEEDPEPEQKGAILAALNALIKDPDLDRSAAFQEVEAFHRVARRAWSRLADPRRASGREMVRCQRLLLESIYGSKLPERKPGKAGDDSPYEYQSEEFRDWKAASAALFEGSTKEGEPRRSVWDSLGETARAAVREGKTGASLSMDAREAVVEGLNAILGGRPLLLDPASQDYLRTKKPSKLIMEFLPSGQSWDEYDFHRHSRAYNRFLLDVLWPKGLGTSRRPEGPPRTIAYRSRGETIGEMSLFEGKSRMATCVAYGHPEDDPEREVSPIQLVRISRELFKELEGASPAFRRYVGALVSERKASAKAQLSVAKKSASNPTARAGRTEELGLLQGQKLMLIDLERCTRCDECVQACVNTHDDGRSRLFLDGPRFDKYLVPTTCRSCLDPVCMIGCPVGSIHRGGNGEIIIEDWCIGCEACASQCPYGAIQMHKNGIIPESSFGWHYAAVADLPADWFRTAGGDRAWQIGSAPLVDDREFRTTLERSRKAWQEVGDRSLAFRYRFEVERDLIGPDQNFILTMTSMDEGLNAWINGRPVVTTPSESGGGDPIDGVVISRRKSRDHGWWEVEAELPHTCLAAGKNVIAVRVTPSSGGSDRLLDLRLDREEGATVKLVEQKAVVCDLCSSQFGQRPACVTACPHDAAIRIDALVQISTL